MYFWNLRRLKDELVGSGIDEPQKLRYLLAVLICVSLAFVGVPNHNFWSLVYGLTFVLALVLAVCIAYRCNGGSRGRDFLSRFVSLTWVCGVRWLFLFIVPLTTIAVALPGTPWMLVLPISPDRPEMRSNDVIMLVLAAPPLLWRIAAQMRDVARRTGDRREEVEHFEYDAPLEPLED